MLARHVIISQIRKKTIKNLAIQGVWDKEQNKVISEIIKECSLIIRKNTAKQKES
jgi:radical SAM superfamily enzyme